MKLTRRDFLVDSVAAAVASAAGGCATGVIGIGSTYPGWRPGELDIHFLHTATAESTFFIFPDGTTMLLDCGHVEQRRPGYAEALPPKPSGKRTAGEWVTRYIKRLIPQREIDYLMISHWHRDHIDAIPEVAKTFRFQNYYDHQFPDTGKYRNDISEDSFKKVQKWLPEAQKDGMKVEPFKVGAKNQIHLQHDAAGYYSRVFEIRNLAANGVVWLGPKGDVRDVVGEHVKKTGKNRIAENALSSAVRISYGKFSYFTGGDIIEGSFQDAEGKTVNYEALVGRAAGPVSVCKTNHHAMPGSLSEDFIRAVRPRLFLSSTCSPNQINDVTLSRMASRELYPGDRTIAFGSIPWFKKLAYKDRDFMRDVAPEGHAVVKVCPGGFAFSLYTLSAEDESMRIVGLRDFVCE